MLAKKSIDILSNIEEMAEVFPVEVLILKKEVKGELKDFLNALSDSQRYIIARSYFSDNKIKNKNSKELIDLLDKKIKESFLELINTMTYNQYKSIDNLSKGIKIDEISLIYLYAGFIYSYHDKNDNISYAIPNDIKKLYLENITDEMKAETIKAEIATKIFSMFFSIGLVREDLIFDDYKDFDGLFTKEEFLNEISSAVIIKEIDNKKYFWLIDIPCNDEYAINIDNRIYIKRNIKDYLDYMLTITQLIESISNILGFSYKETAPIVISKILLKERTTKEVINDFSDEFNLTKNNKKKLESIIEDEYDYIRFFEYGGNTTDEYKALKLLLEKKPKKTSLKDCLNKLSNEGVEQLRDTYYLDDEDIIEEEIISDFNDEGIDYFDDYYEIDDILSLDNEIYNGNDTITSFIINGYAYIYKDKNDIKVIIPDEIKDILYNMPLDDNEEELDDREIVELYMYFNGVIEKEELRKLLKENHNLDYTIKELDTVIKSLDLFSRKDYYSILGDAKEDDMEQMVLSSKKNFKKYKVVDYSSYDIVNMSDAFKDDLKEVLSNLTTDEEKLELISSFIISTIYMNCYLDDALYHILDEYKIKYTNKDIKSLKNIVDQYKNDMPIWGYNGYTKKEFSSMPKEKKIGRNDPCPCWSGKKYKKCCGK